MNRYRRIIYLSIVLPVMLAALVMPSFSCEVSAAPKANTVKVGFYQTDGYHEIDENGVKSGYGYDFLHMTEKYANLNYEYVGYDKTWDEMLEMLSGGQIDMLTQAIKTDEREKLFDFSLPIGYSSVNINTRSTNSTFVAGDYDTYNGASIGLISGAAENDKLAEFAAENGFTYTPVYYDSSEKLADALSHGEVDMVATTSFRKMSGERILTSFDDEEFYAIVRKGDINLLNEINYAIEQMDSNEGDWRNEIYYDNYEADNYDDLTFTDRELDFIKQYSTGGKKLVIATDNDWKPFSWREGNEFKGILPDMLAECMEMAGMDYTFYDFEGSVFDASLESMKNVDLYICYGPDKNIEENGLVASSMFVENGAAFLMRRDTEVINTIAISTSTPNLNTRIDDDMPDGATIIEYSTTDAAKQAVVDGDVDAAFIYSYDAEYTVNTDMTGNLAFTVAPEDPIEIRAVMLESNDHTLMSILMKCLNNFPSTDRTAITSQYVSFTVTDVTITDYMTIHPTVTAVIVVVMSFIIFMVIFMFLRHNAEQKHRKELEDKVSEITLLNAQLNINQRKLEDTTQEQEAQLEEIRQLNEEQVAQLEEITALNTELGDRQDRLEEARDMAEAANNAKTSFLFSMSHDIRTPMNAIIGFTDLLDKYQEDAGRRADYLQKIKDSSAVLLSIINNVLEMARIEKGTIILESVAVDIHSFSDSMYTVFEDMMNQKNLKFTKEVNVKHRFICCDPIKLREVLINIISNAYKYTEHGSVSYIVEEEGSDREGYAMIKTTVADTGMGMAEDFLPHLFEEFSRENNTTDNKIEGTGLGMPIVKRLVELMEGTINVTSKKGEGTTFTIRIPHKIAESADITEVDTTEIDTEIFKGKRILLAEDNELNAEIATEILEEGGFKVELAEDGKVAVDMLDKAADGYFDLILMDVQMPNMNGYEATKIIRQFEDKNKANIPIIAMTANAFEEDKKNAVAAGMNGHLPKPVSVDELYRKLMGIFS